MKFSIIIPMLNEAGSIVNCLTALQPLRTYCEIITVDGGSADNTKELAMPLVDKLILSQKGRAVQMNSGAKSATGDMLVFLHADTFLPDNAITQMSQAINNKYLWGRFDVNLDSNQPLLNVVAFFMNWRSRLTGVATGDQAIFVDKRLFDSVGQYPQIALMEDIALSQALKKLSPPACLFAKVTTSGRRWEQFGVFKTILLMWSLRLRYFLGESPQVLADLYQEGKLWKT
jgi:rSAM/selenodomain-associated transferase 2